MNFLTSVLGVLIPLLLYIVYKLHAFFQTTKNSEKAFALFPLALPAKCHWLLGHVGVFSEGGINAMKAVMDDSSTDGISRFKMAGQNCIIVTKPEHVKSVFLASSYRASIPLLAKHGPMTLGERSLVYLMGNEWKTVRKLVAAAFKLDYLRNIVGDMSSTVNTFTTSLSAKNNEIVDIWPLMKCITVDIIGTNLLRYVSIVALGFKTINTNTRVDRV